MTMNRIYIETQKLVTLEAVREMRHLLEQVTQTVIPNVSLARNMLLCLSEVTTNLVKHPSSEASRMGMCLGRDNFGWQLEILDNGNPWDPTKQVKPGILDEFCDAETGRGIALLHMQCDHIEYYPSNGSQLNRLRLNWKTPDCPRRSKILIVDDDEAVRALYVLYLRDVFDVTTAASGQEALMELNAEQIDLVLSDICMPGMDGMALREYLIEDTDSRLTPFVFLSAMNDTALLEKASGLGIDDYLVKPISKTQLIGTIQRVLKRSRQIYQQLTNRIDEGITSALAPRLPERVNGWRLGVSSRHTGSGGGDLLLYQSGDSRFQIVITDIMGHDDSAKFFAHACGGYLRGIMHAVGAEGDPANMLTQLSDFAMQDKLMSKVTMTCCSASLSPGGEISLASAGHPPPLHISKTGTRQVPVGGILPGLLPATNYQSVSLQLVAGERIALYTDGLFESAADNNARKNLEDRITTTLTDTLNLPINESLAQLMSEFDKLAGTPPRDDALLLLMEPVN